MPTRRDFLSTVLGSSLCFWTALSSTDVVAAPNPKTETPLVEVPSRWWKSLPNGKVQCFLCPFT